MKAGILKEQIEIYAPTVETTDFGNTNTVYSHSYTTRASVRYDSGSRIN